MSKIMACKSNCNILIWIIVSYFYVAIGVVESRGMLLLHTPLDVTNECVFSKKLRYDISFGVGKSDTLTVILRNIPDVDYLCEIDITTDYLNKLVVVIRFPNNVGVNCDYNPEAFHVMKKEECFAICDMLDYRDKFSREWILFTKGRFRFQFRSDSNINTDMNAHYYEVTVTTARVRDENGTCFSESNETECYAPPPFDEYYCITSAVMCDGIANCGVKGWFDEKKSDCDDHQSQLSYVSILAVVGLFLCCLVAGSHILLSCLPQASSFFVYNTNEDNRLCIDPTLTVHGLEASESNMKKRKQSIIPVDWNDSSLEDSEDDDEPNIADLFGMPLSRTPFSHAFHQVREKTKSAKESKTVRTVSQRFQQRLRSIGRQSYNPPENPAGSSQEQKDQQDTEEV